MDKDSKETPLNSKVSEKPKADNDTKEPIPPPCLEPCDPDEDPCCPMNPYDDPSETNPRCKTRVDTIEEVTQKREHMKELLIRAVNGERRPRGRKALADIRTPDYYKHHPETTKSLDFLKSNPEFQLAGPNPMRIPHDELINAMDGFTNMQLAHEISINHDFRLERFRMPADSMETRVSLMMRKAFWDLMDEALAAATPDYAQAIDVFGALKEMLLNLLLPHNQSMRSKIENGLDEKRILEEIRLGTLDFYQYSNFIIETLGQLCCPMRDKQIFALKSLVKPSEVFSGILEVMEQMQLDMANFLIGEFRPTIITNCVEYERLKFADFIKLEYKLREDALRVTRSWLLRHRIDDRRYRTIVGHAFAEILLWKEKEWPETLTLDWVRFAGMAEETRRLSFVAAVVHGSFNAVKLALLKEGQRDDNVKIIKGIVAKLRENANILLTKEDTMDPKKVVETLAIVAEKAIQILSDSMQKFQKRELTSPEKNLIRRGVEDIAREDDQIRPILLRRMQEYVSERLATEGTDTGRTELSNALRVIQEEVLTICAELHRIAMHNRGVFDDLYKAIIRDQVSPPVYASLNGGYQDPMLQKTVDILRVKAAKQFVMTRPADNKNLEGTLDSEGEEILGIEDQPVVETTPEIEAMIDKIIAETTFVDDYDEFANISQETARQLIMKLNTVADDATIWRHMRYEEESNKRIAVKKQQMREELRISIRNDMGLPMFNKVLYKEPKIRTYCKLIKAEAEKKAKAESQEPTSKSESKKPKDKERQL